MPESDDEETQLHHHQQPYLTTFHNLGRDSGTMVIDLDGSWTFDRIFSPSPSSSPFLFSTTAAVTDQPYSPLWAFSDENNDKHNALMATLSPPAAASHGHPDSITGNPPDNKEKRLSLPVFRWTSLDYPDGPSLIKERMTQALRYFTELTQQHFLAQVWVPVKNGSRYMLTTSGQPFVLDSSSTGLHQYRMVSLMYMFPVDEDTDESIGLPGRVFRQKLPEWTPNVQYYSAKEYPLLEHALNYNVRGTLALPVFEPSGHSCVGVIELIMNSQRINYAPEVDKVCKALEAVNLKSSEIRDQSNNTQICNDSRKNALAEILEILTVVCETHNLPFAQTWVPCRHRSVLAYGAGLKNSCSSFDGSCMGQICLSTTKVAVYVVDAHMWGFRDACAEHHLQKGQGVAGKAFASQSSCFCANITEFSKAEYPLVHYARMFGLVGSFAICLRSTYTGEDDYILEFFLPLNVVDTADQQTMLCSLLTTMKQHFRSLRIESGEEIYDVASFEIIKKSINEKRDSNIEFIQLSESNLSPSGPVPEALPNGGAVIELNSLEQPQIVGFDALTNGGDISEDAFLNGVNFVVPEERDNRTCLDEVCRVKTLQRENRVTDHVLSYEVIKEHFGRKLGEAAESLDVSRSTLKRICRTFGIQRWPSQRRKKVKQSHPNVTHSHEFVQCEDEQIPDPRNNRETSSSNLFPTEATAAVALVQDQSSVVIKVTYGEDIIKFELSSSSGMAELVEKVARRLNFKAGTQMRLKYKDDDGDWVLVTCDEDLQYCIRSSGSLGKTAIKFVVHPVTTAESSHASDIVSTFATKTANMHTPATLINTNL